MKSIIAAGILLASGSAASAVTLTSIPFELGVESGPAFSIRRCPVNGDIERGVCYNQDRTINVGLYSFERERAYTIDCQRRLFSGDTVHGRVAKEYCPVRFYLPTAPFIE